MRFTMQYPITGAGYSAAMLDPANVIRVVAAAEDAGFDAIAFTEHPAPSQKWMLAGGHDALDPLTALAFAAAATTRIRLMPYLLVLPYRSGFLAAKQLATLDVLSGGRVIAALGVGYLRSEFAAMGVAFEARNAIFDAAVEAMRGIWTTTGWCGEGPGWQARAQTARPRPLQRPHPPIWFGGNGVRARERVARQGSGWAPLMIGGKVAATVRTPAIPDVAALRVSIVDLYRRLEACDRLPDEVEIQVEWSATNRADAERGALAQRIEELAAAGVTGMIVDPPGEDISETLEAIAQYGDEVIAQSGGSPSSH